MTKPAREGHEKVTRGFLEKANFEKVNSKALGVNGWLPFDYPKFDFAHLSPSPPPPPNTLPSLSIGQNQGPGGLSP